MQCIHGYDAGWDANKLGIGAIIEQKIVAEVLLTANAKIAQAARSGVERNYAVA
jgi:hypothetical protein